MSGVIHHQIPPCNWLLWLKWYDWRHGTQIKLQVDLEKHNRKMCLRQSIISCPVGNHDSPPAYFPVYTQSSLYSTCTQTRKKLHVIYSFYSSCSTKSSSISFLFRFNVCMPSSVKRQPRFSVWCISYKTSPFFLNNLGVMLQFPQKYQTFSFFIGLRNWLEMCAPGKPGPLAFQSNKSFSNLH